MTALLLLPAMALDAAFGEPKRLWDHIPHPAVLMGRAVGYADSRLNSDKDPDELRRLKGTLAMAALGVAAAALGQLIHMLPDFGVIEVIVTAILLAQQSLAEHVRDVARGLRQSLDEGRRMVARIVGRDTMAMDSPAVARAAIESAAENLSDGVIAPIFWYLIGGLPGLMLYKITNTADSMIGHRTPRYQSFGWAAARFDDLLNLIPARLTAVLIAIAQWRPDAAAVILRDARLHRSPNAGWPEAAMAVSLGIALSGPRSYHGEMRDFPWVCPEGRRDPGPADVEAAAVVLWRVWALTAALVGVIALA